MIETDTCPWLAKVKRSQVASLSEDEMDAISEHAAHCDVCRKAMQSPSRLDALCEELREARSQRDQAMVDIAPPATKLNEVLVDYRIESELGRGGMGVVYRAKQLKLNRTVALKVLPALLAAIRPDALERFKREAALAASLKHSNIIGVHDFGDVDGTLFYAMELVEGISLRKFIDEVRETGGLSAALSVIEASVDATPSSGTLSDSDSQRVSERSWGSRHESHRYFRQVAKWMADVADALHYAHDRGVVHRDIKPANLLLSRDGRVMVSDFGLACSSLEGSFGGSVGITRAILGTSRYMSPERLDPTLGKVNRASDVYALGATLYELLTLRPMLPGKDDRTVLHQVLHYDPAPPRSFMKQVPHELETICMIATSKRLAERYQTAEDLANDLRRWLLDLPIMARRPSWPVRAARYVKRRKVTAGLTAGLIVAVMAGAVLAANYWQAQQREAEIREQARQQHIELMRNRITTAFHSGRYDEAHRLLDEALEMLPGDMDLLFERIQVFRVERRPDEAIRLSRDILQDNPNEYRAHAALSFAFYDVDHELAEHHGDRAVELMPDTPEALHVRAVFERDPQRAIDLINEAIARGGNLFRLINHRASRYGQIGNHEARLADAERLVGMRDGWGYTHLVRGNALTALNRHGEAEQAYSRAIELEPHHAMHWHNRSIARTSLGRYSDAIVDANRALETDPTLARAYFALSRARKGQGDLDGALAEATRGLELDPNDLEAYVHRSFLYHRMERWEQQAADAEVCIRLAPSDPRGYRYLFVALYQLRDFEQALASATQYVDLAPDNPEARLFRGILQFELGQYTDAINDFTRGVELQPAATPSYYRRAQCYLRLGRPQAAVADLTRFDELSPDNPRLHLVRGAAFWMLGLDSLARADLERAMTLEGRDGVYAALWKHLLIDNSEGVPTGLVDDEDAWSWAVVRFVIGEASAEALLDRASDAVEQCAAHFYIGMRALLNDDRPSAREAFERSIATEGRLAHEYFLAQEQLRRLERSGRSEEPAFREREDSHRGDS